MKPIRKAATPSLRARSSATQSRAVQSGQDRAQDARRLEHVLQRLQAVIIKPLRDVEAIHYRAIIVR